MIGTGALVDRALRFNANNTVMVDARSNQGNRVEHGLHAFRHGQLEASPWAEPNDMISLHGLKNQLSLKSVKSVALRLQLPAS
jgi:hypothetical protein